GCGRAWGDIAENPDTGELFGILQSCDCATGIGTKLVVINRTTGDVDRLVGCIPFMDVYGIAFDSSCHLWGGDYTTLQLLRIDPSTAETVVAARSFVGTYGMASVPALDDPISSDTLHGTL